MIPDHNGTESGDEIDSDDCGDDEHDITLIADTKQNRNDNLAIVDASLILLVKTILEMI